MDLAISPVVYLRKGKPYERHDFSVSPVLLFPLPFFFSNRQRQKKLFLPPFFLRVVPISSTSTGEHLYGFLHAAWLL
jgi:hypothetical protein